MKKFHMTAIPYNRSIWVVPTNEQLLLEECTCAKSQINIPKTKILVGFIQTGGQTGMAKLILVVTLCILFRTSDVSFLVLQTSWPT